jgi:hypothetical protein
MAEVIFVVPKKPPLWQVRLPKACFLGTGNQQLPILLPCRLLATDSPTKSNPTTAPLFWGARNDVYLAICFGEIRHVGGLDDSVRDASYQKA